jgi:FdhD protein
MTAAAFHADSFSIAILRALAEAPGEGGMSLPRLGKRLGQGASVVMRHLTLMGDAAIGGVRGPGWVRVVQLDDRWVAHLTDAGRAWIEALPADENTG